MPYIRKGKCVYLKTTGKKVGCSSSPEHAKKYIRALHANVHESFDSYVNAILESTALGLMGFTSNQGTAYSYIYDSGMTHSLMINRKVTVNGNVSVLSDINSDMSLLERSDILQWRYNFKNDIVYIWRGNNPKSDFTLDMMKSFFERKRWNVEKIKYIFELDRGEEAEKDFRSSHFMEN